MVASFAGGGDALGAASGSITLRADGALRALDQVGRGLQNLDRQSAGFGTGLTGAIQKNEQAINTLGTGLVSFGVGVVGAFGLMTNTAANFEQSMDGVAASLGGVGDGAAVTEAQFAALSDEALRVGATTSKSATEAAGAMDLMAKAGINVETIINGGAQAVVNLSEATSEGLNQSAATVSSLFLLFEDTGISVSQMADSITTAMNNSNASLSEFQTGMARLAPVVKGGSLSFEEAAASVAYFNQQGFSAAETGTSLFSIFQSVSAPTKDMAAALDEAGISAFNAAGEFVGFPKLFDQVAKATEGMTEEQKANFLSTAFMTDGMDLLAVATGSTQEEIEALEDEIAKSGSAAEASATRMDNLKGDIEQLGGAFETVSVKIGSIFLPILRSMAQFVTSVVTAIGNLPTPLIALVSIMTAGAGALALFGGGLLLLLPRIVETRAALQALGGVRGVIALLTGSLRAMAAAILFNPVFLLATAAAIGAIVAYRSNFLGITDAVESFVAAWQGLGSTTNNPVTRFLSSLGVGLLQLDIGPLQDFGNLLIDIGETIEAMVDAVGNLRSQGFDPLQAVLLTIGGTFESLLPTMQNLYVVITSTVDALRSFVSGDFDAGFDSLGNAADAARAIIRDLGSALGNVVGRLVNWTLDVAVPTVTGWIVDNADDVWGALTSAAGWLWTGLVNLGSITLAIAGFLRGSVPDLRDFLLQWMRELIATAGEIAGDLARATVNLLAWARGNAPAIRAFLLQWVVELIAVAGPIADSIEQVTINILEWAQGAIPDLSEDIAAWVGTQIANIETVILQILNFEPIINADVDKAIREALGTVIVSLSELAVTISEDAVGIATSAAKIAGYIFAAVVALAIVIPAVSVSVPFLLIAGAIVAAIGLFIAVIGFATRWAYDHPIEALEVLANISIALDNITSDISIQDIIDGFLELIGLGKGSPIRIPIDAIIDLNIGDQNKAVPIEELPPGVEEDGGYSEEGLQGPPVPKPQGFLGRGGGLAEFGAQIATQLQAITATITTETAKWPPPVTTSATSMRTQLLTAATAMHAGLTTSLGAMLATTTTTFTGMRTVGTTAALALQTGVLASAGATVAGWASNLASMAGTTTSRFGAIRTTGTTETNALQSSALANAGSMIAGWASRLASMASTTGSRFGDIRSTGTSETNSLEANATASIGSLAGSWASRLADMAGSTGRQFGTIRSTGTAETNSLSANVGSNIGSMASNSAVRIAGMQAGLALKFLGMKASAVGSSQDMSAQVVSVHASMGVQAALAAGRGLSTIPGIVRSVGSAAASVGYSAGANISRGFANGMYAYLGSIRAAANAMVSAAYAAVRARALIASPSRLFAGLGEQMGEGLAVGMEAKRERLARVARDITTMLAGITQTGVRDLTSSLDTVLSQPIMNRQGQRLVPELSVNNSGMGGGTTVHNHNYYSVTPDDLKNLIDNANAGGEFARDFGGGIAKRRGSL